MNQADDIFKRVEERLSQKYGHFLLTPRGAYLPELMDVLLEYAEVRAAMEELK